MKVGDYVRTKRGQIYRITDLKKCYENDVLIEDKQLVHIDNHFSGWNLGQFKELIVKSSLNIIDLIEVGDYVNGFLVIHKENDYVRICPAILPLDLKEKDIKSIITKEQFESMEYKVGD